MTRFIVSEPNEIAEPVAARGDGVKTLTTALAVLSGGTFVGTLFPLPFSLPSVVPWEVATLAGCAVLFLTCAVVMIREGWAVR